jgi:hypothetical protein
MSGRLVLNRELDEADIDALTEICKSAHGLAKEQDVIPLGPGGESDCLFTQAESFIEYTSFTIIQRAPSS